MYIDFEIKEGDPARVQIIFERALAENCLVPDLWIKYTTYLVSDSHKHTSAFTQLPFAELTKNECASAHVFQPHTFLRLFRNILIALMGW